MRRALGTRASGRRSLVFAASVVWTLASAVALVVGQFLPHTEGVAHWDRESSGLFASYRYDYGSLTGWEWGGGWWIAIAPVISAISIVGYVFWGRSRLLVVALAAAALAMAYELLGLAFLPDECGDGFFEVTCPPGFDEMRWAAWGLYFTLGASLSLTLACVTLLVLRRTEPRSL